VTDLPVIGFEWPHGVGAEEVLCHEWLVTNGLGGYASGTAGLCNTRRYHGVFVPALPAPFGRTVMLPRLGEELRVDGRGWRIDGEELDDGALELPARVQLRAFRVLGLIPEWELEVGPVRLRRRIVMVHGENAVFVEWQHLSGPPAQLLLRPFPAFRFHDRPLPHAPESTLARIDGFLVELAHPGDALPLRLRIHAAEPSPFVALPAVAKEAFYRIEHRRGLDYAERLSSPGYFDCRLPPGGRVALGITSDGWEVVEGDPARFFDLEHEREHKLLCRCNDTGAGGPLEPPADPVVARLVLAADQFIIDPSVRPADAAWARAMGQDARSVIAGYHWFTDWGRDTMISLEGLTLRTGRLREAGAILRTFQHYVRDGLLPNLFPEGGREGMYHTADATLWFFHAIDRYLQASHDEELLRDIYPTMEEIVARHLQGTRFGIGVDPADGLLRQGAEGYQLTWMDAKVDGWVVTPRRGKAVELCALWFNALRLMEEWAQALGHDPKPFATWAQRCHQSFNARFWNERTGCLFDVVDAEGGGDDPAVRPNQVFAISLRHPVLWPQRWEPVLQKVRQELLTPVGLRTLSRDHPQYKATYDGDLRARDAAYHQGTVWPWLLGHFTDAWLKLHPDRKAARAMLAGLQAHLRDTGIGQVNEIFDATEPYRARGCMAQAWSVAELLRAWIATDEGSSRV
jgi:glycogen debranching enzyme